MNGAENRIDELTRENQRLRLVLDRLDELPGKDSRGAAKRLKGVADLKTGMRSNARSIPGKDNRCFLALHLLRQEKERLLKRFVRETTWLKKLRIGAERRLAELDREMARQEGKAMQDMGLSAGHPAPERIEPTGEKPEPGEKRWHRLTVGY